MNLPMRRRRNTPCALRFPEKPGLLLLLMLHVLLGAPQSLAQDTTKIQSDMTEKILLLTLPGGEVRIKLYNETPRHRDNMLKLVEEGFYDGTLFHRVIRDFMVQGGDPDSRTAQKGDSLGRGDVGYTIPAEFSPRLFHKKGALCAARQGDEVNPEKASSGCQFYIVTGKKYNRSQLRQMEEQMTLQRAQIFFQQLAKERYEDIKRLRQERNRNGMYALQEELAAQAEEMAREKDPFRFSEEQIEAYTSEGGAPFLDGSYTVFGEVVSGMDVIEELEKVKTDRNDRPAEDVPMRITVAEE